MQVPRLSAVATLSVLIGLSAPQCAVRAQDEPGRPGPTRESAVRPVPPATPAGEPERPADKPTDSEEPRPTGFLGDTSRFTRVGGWGSVGGAMGQWGLAKSALIMMPAVQEELQVTADQERKLQDWRDRMRERGQEWGRGLREQGDAPVPRADMPVAERLRQFTGFMARVGTLLQENEAGIQRILDRDQRKRLTQIALQMEGIAALAKPEVARAINLSPSQQLRIQQVLNQSRTLQMMTWIAQAPMFRGPRGEGPDRAGREADGAAPVESASPGATSKSTGSGASSRPAGDVPGQDAPDPDQSANPVASRTARDERMKSFQKQFATVRDRTDQIQERTVRELLKILTVRQRTNFEKLLGEPFDPGKVNTFGRARPEEKKPTEEEDEKVVEPRATEAP